MTFKERLPFFLGGLIIGIILVVFFLGKKDTSFDYLPNARVLKNIRTKTRIFSEEAQLNLKTYKIDTASISQILKNGDVNLMDKIKLDTCVQYYIQGENELKNIELTIKNCESVAFIESIKVN
jgi:hypothetical protein